MTSLLNYFASNTYRSKELLKSRLFEWLRVFLPRDAL